MGQERGWGGGGRWRLIFVPREFLSCVCVSRSEFDYANQSGGRMGGRWGRRVGGPGESVQL